MPRRTAASAPPPEGRRARGRRRRARCRRARARGRLRAHRRRRGAAPRPPPAWRSRPPSRPTTPPRIDPAPRPGWPSGQPNSPCRWRPVLDKGVAGDVRLAEPGRIATGHAWRNPRQAVDIREKRRLLFASAVATWPRDGVPRSPKAWLTTTARRKAIDRIRRRRAADDRVARLAELARLDAPGAPAPRARRAGRRRRRRAGRRCRGERRRGRPVAVDLHVLPPGAEPAGPGGADAPDARRADDPGDRPGLPRARGDDGPADRPRQAQDRRRPHPVPGAARPRPSRAARRGPVGPLPDLQRGVRRRRGRPAAPRPDARRAGGGWAAGAHAPARRPPGGPGRRRRRLRPAGPAGPLSLGRRARGRGRPRPGTGVEPAPTRSVPAAGGHRRPARPGAPRRGHRLGRGRRAVRRTRPGGAVAGGGGEPCGGRRFAEGAQAGLAVLAPLADDRALAGYQPLHAARAALLARSGDTAAAADAYRTAMGLSANAVERAELESRLGAL